jgi:hypothetical protein
MTDTVKTAGSKGGKARNAKLTPEQRSKHGRQLAKKRWRMSREEWRLVRLLRYYASLNGRTLEIALSDAIEREKQRKEAGEGGYL